MEKSNEVNSVNVFSLVVSISASTSKLKECLVGMRCFFFPFNQLAVMKFWLDKAQEGSLKVVVVFFLGGLFILLIVTTTVITHFMEGP